MRSPGEPAPDFRLARLKDGQSFHLKTELEKGPVMLVFVKESCPTCRFALPLIERAARPAQGASGQILLVVQDLPWTARSLVKELDLQIPVAVDEEPFPVSQSFDIAFVPSAFYIHPNGRIHSASESFERDALAEMLAGLAQANGKAPMAFAPPGSDVPPFRPG